MLILSKKETAARLSVQPFVFKLSNSFNKPFHSSLAKHAPCTIWSTVVYITCRNTNARVTCMNNSSTANAERNVVYPSTTCIEDQITCFCTGRTDLFTNTGLCTGSTWQADTKLLKYRHGKSGTVCTICQAGTSIHIRITYKFQTI